MTSAAIAAASAVLAHVPGLVPHGSKPARLIAADPLASGRILAALRSYEAAVAYPPNQAFVGGLHPRSMGERPWLARPLRAAARFTAFGEILPEGEHLGLLALADEFDAFRLSQAAAEEAREALGRHPLASFLPLDRLAKHVGDPAVEVARGALPLRLASGELVGSVAGADREDPTLSASVLLENFACKATGALALAHLLHRHAIPRESIEFVIGCSEEAVGDRYQRGGGNMAKAIAAMLDLGEASGADVKNFCAAPIPALVIAASLVAAGVFRNVAVVGGGSLPKLGMKIEGHLKSAMPVLEDVLGAVAALVTADDGRSPVLRLDAVGRHRVSAAGSQAAIMEALAMEPLRRIGIAPTDVDRYATELHNPEVTEPQGSGNVPERNYKLIAALAAKLGAIGRDETDAFVARRGMPGFAPTQGHIASAVCYLPHALEELTAGDATRILFLAKGSLFLGRMSDHSDGMSFLLERNPRR